LPSDPASGVRAPDTFGSTPGAPTVVDATTGITWTLGFNHATNPPTPIYVAISTWGRAKTHWRTWADAKASASTWGVAKAIAAT